MNNNRLNIDDFLRKSADGGVIIDVRTPAEYELGHIEGAHNIPLFSNEERIVVGTIYKRVGKDKAVEKGLEFVGGKMVNMVRRAKEIAAGRTIYLYCWRGGMRSGSVAWLFMTAGIRCYVLDGGYKKYRGEFVNIVSRFKDKLIVIGGPTGAGKTEILSKMASLGEQVIDLEGLACHRGSAFGGIGMQNQPNNETFTNKLSDILRHFDHNKRIWCEGESVSIGKVFLPDIFYNLMQESPYVYVDMPSNIRLNRIEKEYGCFDIQPIIDSFVKITKRMGGQNIKAALEFLNAGDIRSAAALALDYYDRGYNKSIFSRNADTIIKVSLDRDDPMENATKIIGAINNITK